MTKQQKVLGQFYADMENIYNLKPDRWGNIVFSQRETGKLYRIKPMKQVVRIETKIGKCWCRVGSVKLVLHKTATELLKQWLLSKVPFDQ